jgi:hypothetical protein
MLTDASRRSVRALTVVLVFTCASSAVAQPAPVDTLLGISDAGANPDWLVDAGAQDAGAADMVCDWPPDTNWAELIARGVRDFDGCDLSLLPRPLRLHRANLRGARSEGSSFYVSPDFSHADLTDADLSRQRFQQANFNSATLVGTSFRDADLSMSSFIGANLSGADFRGAQLGATRFRNVRGLTQATLAGACGGSQTELPPPLVLERCLPQVANGTPTAAESDTYPILFAIYLALQILALFIARGSLRYWALLPIFITPAITLMSLIGASDTGGALLVALLPIGMVTLGLRWAPLLLVYQALVIIVAIGVRRSAHLFHD